MSLAGGDEDARSPEEGEQEPREADIGGRQLVGLRVDDDDRGIDEQQPDDRRAAVEPAEEPRGEVEQEDRDEGTGDRLPVVATLIPIPIRTVATGAAKGNLFTKRSGSAISATSNGKSQPGPLLTPSTVAEASPSTTPARARSTAVLSTHQTRRNSVIRSTRQR